MAVGEYPADNVPAFRTARAGQYPAKRRSSNKKTTGSKKNQGDDLTPVMLARRLTSVPMSSGGPRRDCILVGGVLALILAVLFNFFAQGRNLAAVPTEASQAGRASTKLLRLSQCPPSELRVATVDALSQRRAQRVQPSRGQCLTRWLHSTPPIA
jgi:hypothetical protein